MASKYGMRPMKLPKKGVPFIAFGTKDFRYMVEGENLPPKLIEEAMAAWSVIYERHCEERRARALGAADAE